MNEFEKESREREDTIPAAPQGETPEDTASRQEAEAPAPEEAGRQDAVPQVQSQDSVPPATPEEVHGATPEVPAAAGWERLPDLPAAEGWGSAPDIPPVESAGWQSTPPVPPAGGWGDPPRTEAAAAAPVPPAPAAAQGNGQPGGFRGDSYDVPAAAASPQAPDRTAFTEGAPCQPNPAAAAQVPPAPAAAQGNGQPGGFFQGGGGGYYVPPAGGQVPGQPGGWQSYPPQPYPQPWGGQQGPNTTGWQRPAPAPWQQPNTTGWAPQGYRPPGGSGQPAGYRPQGVPAQTGGWEAAGAAAPGKKKGGPRKVLLTIVGVAAAIAVIAMAGYGIYTAATGENPLAAPPKGPSAFQGGQGGSNQVPDVPINDKPSGGDQYDGREPGTLSNSDIFRKVSPSVVGIVAQMGDGFYGNSSQGSGIIMSEDGYIITNAHVVEGFQRYEVVLTGGESCDAELVGADRSSDLAVLKINRTGLTAAEFGDSDQVVVGERACVIGNPGGMRFQNSLTVGYISALGRTINTGGYSIDCIQTDAAINPGNSGGPLINAYGQVIGISSAKIALTDYEGICFAIPITDAMPILKQLIADGKVTGRALLGISAKAVKATEAEFYEIPLGLWVVSVSPGADIGAQGVREGDIITHVDDKPVYTLDACSTILKDFRPGDTISVTVFRRENTMTDNTFKVEIVLQGS